MIPPSKIRIDDPVKIIGHNLYGRNFTLNPVNSEIRDRIFRNPKTHIYTNLEIARAGSARVITRTRIPRKISVAPSLIHSIAMMFLLSADMAPNPFTTFFVGNR